MLRVIRLTSILATMLAAMPAFGQVYKWVDEQGVTNYSSEPPADINANAKPVSVADRISIYAPEPAIERAIRATAANRERINANRIDELERQLAAERRLSPYAAAADAGAAQAAYEQCLAARGVDCDYGRGYHPYGGGGVVTVLRHRPWPHIPSMARSRVATETNHARALQWPTSPRRGFRPSGPRADVAMRMIPRPSPLVRQIEIDPRRSVRR